MTGTPLVIAVPSKGRLQENAGAFFARAGLALAQAKGGREYRGSLAGVPGAEVAFLSAAEIVTQLVAGRAHLGVTGEDLLRESVPHADTSVELITGLGFGHANVVVAVPQAWIDVRTMADLDEVAAELRSRRGRRLRVATKYANLTRRFFAEKGVADYRIVESLGATEGTPATGTADLIVDITTTGATLAANHLRILDDGVILRSEANLIASLAAPWPEPTLDVVRGVLARIAAEEEARTTREIRASVDPDRVDVAALMEQSPGARLLAGGDVTEFVVRCPVAGAFDLVQALIAAGATEVTVRSLDYVFRPTNPFTERLLRRLDARA